MQIKKQQKNGKKKTCKLLCDQKHQPEKGGTKASIPSTPIFHHTFHPETLQYISPIYFSPRDFSPRNSSCTDFWPIYFSQRDSSPNFFSCTYFSPIYFSPRDSSPRNSSCTDFSPRDSSPRNSSCTYFSPIYTFYPETSPRNSSCTYFSPRYFSPGEQKYDFSVFEVRSIGEAAKDHKNALNFERIRYAAHLAKKYHHGTSAHHMVLIKTAIFPLLFQCFTRALRDLASFYPLLIVSTVVINFPSVLLKFAIAFPFFSHCFTSYSLICSLFIPNFRHMAWRLHCLQNLGKNWTSAHHMCVISSYRNCNFSIAFPLRDTGP